MMELTRRIRDMMMEERLMFVYRGIVTTENSVPLLMLLEKEMEHSEFGFIGRKRLFMFVLESLQNVSRHSIVRNREHLSLVVYSKTDQGYTVTTGNVLPNESIDDLRSRLKEINNLDAREIRDAYRNMLASSELSTKGGAGLGLIEMAKKTGNKLDYDFVPLDGETSYFVLSKTVDSGGKGVHIRGENEFHGKAIAQMERIMAENNVYLIWCGHITPDVGKEVVSFTETKLIEDEVHLTLKKRVFSILVEILENLAKYSPGQGPEKAFGMPVAMIRMDGKNYYLTTGNLILNSDTEILKGKLDIINQNDSMGLKELFRESLSGQTLKTESTGNMGLIDMARKSGGKLTYQFERISELYSYYTLTVKVDERQINSRS